MYSKSKTTFLSVLLLAGPAFCEAENRQYTWNPQSNTAKMIPDFNYFTDTPGLLQANVAVDEACDVTNVRVVAKFIHEYFYDLKVSLIPPGDNANAALLFREEEGNDSGLTTITVDDLQYQGAIESEGKSLSNIQGDFDAGDWTLKVEDILEDDVGTLENFKLFLTCAEEDETPELEVFFLDENDTEEDSSSEWNLPTGLPLRFRVSSSDEDIGVERFISMTLSSVGEPSLAPIEFVKSFELLSTTLDVTVDCETNPGQCDCTMILPSDPFFDKEHNLEITGYAQFEDSNSVAFDVEFRTLSPTDDGDDDSPNPLFIVGTDDDDGDNDSTSAGASSAMTMIQSALALVVAVLVVAF
jgi:subtilisin-like proprotein convertase family protein